MVLNIGEKLKFLLLIFCHIIIIIFPIHSFSQNLSSNDSIKTDTIKQINNIAQINDSIKRDSSKQNIFFTNGYDSIVKNTPIIFQMPPIIPKKYHTLKTSGILLGASIVTFAILWVMPSKFTRWDPDYGERIKDAGQNLKSSWTKPPVFDHDKWQLNYIAHPVGGMYTYLTERNHNRSIWRAFGYSLFTSCMWEYVIEGIAEQPSIQDLIVTPIAGSLLGEGIFQLTLMMRKNGFTLTEKIITTVINPIYVMQRGFKK